MLFIVVFYYYCYYYYYYYFDCCKIQKKKKPKKKKKILEVVFETGLLAYPEKKRIEMLSIHICGTKNESQFYIYSNM